MTSPLRGSSWGYTATASRPPNAALTDDQVRSIRQRLAAGEARKTIAAEFGLSKERVQALATRRSYANVR